MLRIVSLCPLRPAKKSSSGSSSSVADPNDLCRYGSLAYSSSGDFSNCAELDALLQPRDNSCGMTASQAAAAKSATVVVAAAAAAAGGGEVGGGCPPVALTPIAAGRRQLGKRELDALQAVRSNGPGVLGKQRPARVLLLAIIVRAAWRGG